MSVRLIELGKRPDPLIAAVQDVFGILEARAGNDGAGEMGNWTFLGRDGVEFVETLPRRSQP